MNGKSEYVSLVIAYLIVLLYLILDNNPLITGILILLLLAYHAVSITRVQKRLFEDKESSLSKLRVRLDKTKKKQEESYKQFMSLSSSFGSGLLLVDEEGIVNFANDEIKQYFNEKFETKPYEELKHLKRLYNFVNQAYLLEVTQRTQIKYHKRYYDLISTPLFEKNLFRGCLILCHDITLIKNAEKYQKRFTADVSHELRTPLSAIKGFSEILSRDTVISVEDQQEFIGLIQQEAARMEIILNDLMIISKMDRLDYELEFGQYDIALVIEECAAVLKNQLSIKGLQFISTVESQQMMIDKFKMSQVILNILKNAINYTDKGYVSIEGEQDENNYVIKIQDTGIGIDKKNYDKIFKRFYRVDKARSRDTGGSGLGLSISKNVILKHGGYISVESEPQKGTTFIISLPIKE